MNGRKKGTKKTGGRKKGIPNKINAELKEMILQALNEACPKGAVQYLKLQAIESPTAFLSLVGKVLPLTIAGDAKNPIENKLTIEWQKPKE
jgi:hypothetical protein